jgi:hypothetical protein
LHRTKIIVGVSFIAHNEFLIALFYGLSFSVSAGNATHFEEFLMRKRVCNIPLVTAWAACMLSAFQLTSHAETPESTRTVTRINPSIASFAAAKSVKSTSALVPAEKTLSSGGQLARDAILRHQEMMKGSVGSVSNAKKNCTGADCPRGRFVDSDNPVIGSGQSETSIGVDRAGRNIILGYNDVRGFSRVDGTVSVSGFQYSSDGGRTFTDGGQLPTGPTTDLLNAQGVLVGKYPQIFGDTDIKYISGNTFICSSILVKLAANPAGEKVPVQSMGIHRTRDGGRTWEGPFEVTAASNPNGKFDSAGQVTDAADKEYLDVDPETGRVIISWTNFTDSLTEMRAAISDDIEAAVPTWNKGVVVSSTNLDGQGSVPRFAGSGSQNAYVVWMRSSSFAERSIAIARSTDNGKTFGAPATISNGLPSASGTAGAFIQMDYVLGNDRVNAFPSLAVDKSSSRYRNSVYVVYAAKTTSGADGSDIIFQRSTDEGATFTAPVAVNARPQQDRGQWFPWVTVDTLSGRVWVFYYDQGIADTGDLTQVSYTYSDDGGNRWSKPAAMSKPFRAGHGNDTSQPNLGDYNQAVAQNLELFAVFATTEQPKFTDGLPGLQPDVTFKRLNLFDALKPSLSIGNLSVKDSGGDGFINAGETLEVTVPLFNDVTNPINASSVPSPFVSLSTSTPGISPIFNISTYPTITAGATKSNTIPFKFRVAPSFVPGTPVVFNADLITAQGFNRLTETVPSGTPVLTPLLSEDFETAAPGALPTGWVAAHAAGRNIVPWTSRKGLCADNPTNAGFHINAEDGVAPTPPATAVNSSRWERLFSPTIKVPEDANYLQVEFDVCYDTEEEAFYNILAYDGMFLRITDVTDPANVRSILAEAVARDFSTGDIEHYPRHLIRSSNPDYFSDMSAWAGSSGGKSKKVRLTVPGIAGRSVQLRFEYTQDSNTICSDLRPGATCGVSVDNIKVQSAAVK